MMKKNIGNLGEGYSCKYLIAEGFRILERNYKTKFGEIDVIAKMDNMIVFIEVKTRRNNTFGLPREAVNFKKQSNYYRLAQYYIQQQGFKKEITYRFDVIEVYLHNKDYKIEHIENAF